MGVVIHHYISLYSFVMGVFWFNVFVILGLLMRKLKFPIKFSVIPLLLLLALSVLRMFIVIDIPVAVVVFSETFYPALVSFLRREIAPNIVLGLPINVVNIFVCVWIIVAVWLIARYFYDYIIKFRPIMNWLNSYERDEYAESLLADIIGSNGKFCVFRNGCLNTAVATAFRPYIILPKVEFTDDELRVILLHEWKHIQDKDYLIGIIVNVICFVFWWNPLVYILRKNFRFAQELKCDQFAVAKKKDFKHYLKGLLLLERPNKTDAQIENVMVNTFISGDDGLSDRLEVLAMQGESRSKRMLSNVCYSAVIISLFVASYMFTILPAFRESPYELVTTEILIEACSEYGGVFRAVENYVIDNGDGTFSLYIDGQFVKYMSGAGEFFDFLPVRKRE